MATDTRVSEATRVLIEARRLVARPNGWAQGRMSKIVPLAPIGCITAYCTLGAINKAAMTVGASADEPSRLIQPALAEALGRPLYVTTPSLNDSPMTRQADVIRAFDLAIKESKRRG